MRCLSCAGRGWVRNESADQVLLPAIPCPRCNGSGYDHCCEGHDASCEVLVEESSPALPVQIPVSFATFSPKPAA